MLSRDGLITDHYIPETTLVTMGRIPSFTPSGETLSFSLNLRALHSQSNKVWYLKKKYHSDLLFSSYANTGASMVLW